MAENTPTGGQVLIVDDDRTLRHMLSTLLSTAGYVVEQAADGHEALRKVGEARFDVVLLDVGLPGLNGLEVLEQLRVGVRPPRAIVMTADDTPATLLEAVRRQAYRYVRKPFAPISLVEVIDDAMAHAPTADLPIEVVSARPEWLEIIAPCALPMTDRIQSFVMQLVADLPDEVRESVAQAFRELLNNAIEWGGRLDPTRKVRISCVRAKRLLLYRITDPGDGFDIGRLEHAAISNPDDDPIQHATVREQLGLRPGGLGLMMTQSMVDELIYNEARNEVLLIKYLD